MSDFGFLGFTIASLLYLILSLLLATSWRGRLQGGLMLAASIVSAFWAGLFAADSYFMVIPASAIWPIEALKNITWCAFLIGLLSQIAHGRKVSIRGYRIIALLILLASVVIVIPDNYAPSILLLDMRYLGQVISAIAGMMLVEQFYRNTPTQQRWGIKYLCFGLGGMFMFDFYLFSDALLFKRINFDLWYARGGIYAITVPLLAVSAARNPNWSLISSSPEGWCFIPLRCSLPVYTCCLWRSPDTTSGSTAGLGARCCRSPFSSPPCWPCWQFSFGTGACSG